MRSFVVMIDKISFDLDVSSIYAKILFFGSYIHKDGLLSSYKTKI